MIMTIGHSTRGLDEFLALLRAHDGGVVVDVRRYPASRRHPHFARAPLERALRDAGVGYLHAEQLGGRRSVAADSPNAGLRDPAFRGYADHTRTAEFARALDALLALEPDRPVVMCAEAVPRRCHRWILSDVLVARGVAVEHVIDARSRRAHTLAAGAVVEDGAVVYPGEPTLSL